MARIATFLTPAFLILFLTTAVAQEEPTFRFDLFELPHGEEGNHVQSIAQDSFGFIWFGSRHGLHRWDGYQFKTYVFKPYDANSLSSNYIEYIYVARDGSLWIGAWGGGLSHFNPKTEVFTRYKHIPENPASLSNDFVSEILEDRQGYLWVATLQGLNRLDPTTGQFRRFVHDPYNPFSLSYDKCRTLYLDSDGVLWVGAGWIWETDQGGGLNRFDPKSETFTRYLHDRRNPKSLVSNKVSEIFEDSKGNFWVGTEGDGLHLMDRKTGAFTRMENSPERAEKLSSPVRRNTPEGHVRFILEDRDRDLWVGAWGGGIKYYDPASGYIRHFHAGQPFPTVPDNSVWRLIQSKDGAFWGCTAGEPGRVFRVLKVKEKVDEKREVEAIEFLSPPDIGDRFSELPPKARITDFQLLDQPGNEKANPFLPEDFWEKPELSLRYDQNMFTFRFAAMDFTQPENNRYEFQLVGYDKFWRKSGLEPLANYVKVPPGDYTFRVRAANTDGIWGEPVSVRLFISAPWWATWWAYAGYILLAIALILGIYRFMLNRRLEQAEARRLRELDTVKTQLYTNITHEFRTPLTVILGMARQALDSPKENFRQSQEMIIRNGENLLSLVNQLLDLSRLESGKMGLRLERGDVLAYLKYLLESFHSFAESRQVQIHFLSEEEALTMDYDPGKLQQIVLNLLSNAVKFTPAGGHVYVQCSVASPSVSVGSGDDFLLLKVKDTGKGIPAGHLPYIFDRFYQADDSNTKERGGSGIGLALTKELVQLMGGDISVKSREGHGTEVAVSLPIRLARETRPAQAMFLQPLIAKPISPLSEKPALAPALSPEPETDTGNPTILIVEDHADVVQFSVFLPGGFLPDQDRQRRAGGDRHCPGDRSRPDYFGRHDAPEGWLRALPGAEKRRAHQPYPHRHAHGKGGYGEQVGRAGMRRRRLSGKALSQRGTAYPHQETDRAAPEIAGLLPCLGRPWRAIGGHEGYSENGGDGGLFREKSAQGGGGQYRKLRFQRGAIVPGDRHEQFPTAPEVVSADGFFRHQVHPLRAAQPRQGTPSEPRPLDHRRGLRFGIQRPELFRAGV
ncbi:MAG: hypothetical protein IPJ00_19815 [Saprospirales bacterium]|nr:hypothetical protein [Saprospirales bacterium]